MIYIHDYFELIVIRLLLDPVIECINKDAHILLFYKFI